MPSNPHRISCLLAPLLALTWVSFNAVVSTAREREVAGPAALERRIDEAIRQTEARRGSWGIIVARLPDGKVLYSSRSDHLFQPASNMKLFTSAAALEKLGPDFVFRTTVESDMPPDNEGWVSNLYLVGRGDPNLSSRVLPYQPKPVAGSPADAAFQNLADQVVARGVREVGGNLVADDSYFLFEPYSHDWAEEDLIWGYAAPVTALAFNDNALVLHARPAAAVGGLAQVWLDPVADYYQLNNRLETAAPGTKERIFVERGRDPRELDVWGEIAANTVESQGEGTLAIADPPRLIGEMFRRMLEKRGVIVRGQVEVRHLTRFEAATSPDAGNSFAPPLPRALLAEHDSLPLGEDTKVINKVSQNLHAEMLLRTLARETKNYGSLTVGLQALQEFCLQAGIEAIEFHFADGSGLSRETLVTPGAILRLLVFMARSPRFAAFYDSLPTAGVDGTLNDRFKDTVAEGKIHAKTGTIEHVNSLSGYMDLPAGKRIAFSIIGNSDPLESKDGEKILDGVALTIYEWFARKKGKL
jgi:serine-type D-Ala-D-Ala carboxypeptidase/endopeptidase (penicillin-binding protein 4)